MPTTETPDKKYFNLAEANRLVGCVDGVVIDHKHGYVGRIVKDLMDTYSALIMVRRNIERLTSKRASKNELDQLEEIFETKIGELGNLVDELHAVGVEFTS